MPASTIRFPINPSIARCRSAAALLAATFAVACATHSSVIVAATRPADAVPGSAASAASRWPIRVREHVDLWLHGFAMLQPDSSLVPYYRLGYDRELRDERRRLGVTTLLDANVVRLREGLATNPGLQASQFLALYFPTWDSLRQGETLFLNADGDSHAVRGQAAATTVATFATYFPTRADREWMRLFIRSLEDEREKFFAGWWMRQQRERAAVLASVDQEWRSRDLPALIPFLDHARLPRGDVILALPLAGEGRTLRRPSQRAIVAVSYPGDVSSADQATFSFVHEAVGTIASAVVTDNSTPQQRRSGEADRDASLATVRGGEMLLARVLPEQRDAYMRFYLTLARVEPRDGALEEQFERTFPLSDRLRDAMRRQIDIILGGT